MAFNNNDEEDFEDIYTNKFNALFVGSGIELKYSRDRGGIDSGWQIKSNGKITHTRVWFQLKGRHTATLSVSQIEKIDTVPITVDLEHLRFWYAAPEATYVAVYLEAIDQFIAEDVRDIVERQWKHLFLAAGTFPADQKNVTIHLKTSAILLRSTVESLLKHRSMRIDGPQWRGRPLGHSIDPLRSALAALKPADYIDIVNRLLEAHGFKVYEQLDVRLLFPDSADSDGLILMRGRMHSTYEWTHPMFTEFGHDNSENVLRIEGQMLSIQGDCFVVIDSKGDGKPKNSRRFQAIAKQHNIKQLLVFINKPMEPKTVGSYRNVVKPVECMVPQDLDSLAFNVLTATTIYLDFRDRLSWRYVNYINS